MPTYVCPDCGICHESDVESGDQFLVCPECERATADLYTTVLEDAAGDIVDMLRAHQVHARVTSQRAEHGEEEWTVRITPADYPAADRLLAELAETW